MASYKENKFPLGKELIQLEKGEFITSELKLMDKWKWSKSKVRNFLALLENDGMITKTTDHKKTAINIVNYSVYQNMQTIERPFKDRTFFNDVQNTDEKTDPKKTATNPVNTSVLEEMQTTKELQKDREETAKELQKDTINKDNKGNKGNKKDIYSPAAPGIVSEIIDHLNLCAGTNYKATSKATQAKINARLNEGYKLNDFIEVVNKKCFEWLNRPDMVMYLRPETLFGTKFESYLNQPITKALSKGEQAMINTLNYEFKGDYGFDEE